jgi:hypothetical protein
MLNWDRSLIEYKVNDLSPAEKEYEPDSKRQHWDFADVGDFRDGKNLVLKANFVITNLTHKKACVQPKEIEHGNKFGHYCVFEEYKKKERFGSYSDER